MIFILDVDTPASKWNSQSVLQSISDFVYRRRSKLFLGIVCRLSKCLNESDSSSYI